MLFVIFLFKNYIIKNVVTSFVVQNIIHKSYYAYNL
jgi:hypothetical protein